MRKKYIAEELLNKYRDGTCTDEEKAVVESWHLQQLAQKQVRISEDELESAGDNIWNELPVNQPRRSKTITILKYVAAASVLLFLSASLYFLTLGQKKSQVQTTQTKSKAPAGQPGGNRAVLTLADGSQIILDSVSNGKLASQLNASVTKTAEGTLVYNLKNLGEEDHASAVPLYNTLSVPRGGQYQVVLPDGTSVWMNSLSSLRFPVVFAGDERVVELSGEAYFDVASDKHKPFRVVTGQQTIEVLGTHFNINAYDDESEIKTTLFEGAVKVVSASGGMLIGPGQQTVLSRSSNAIKIQKADLNATLAWKNGYFEFKNEKIESIMRKISRWYDVEVIYKMGYTRQTYVGSISKFENVSKVLTMLELTGTTNLKLEGRRIIVMP